MEVETEHPNAMRRMSYKEVRHLVPDPFLCPRFGCSIFCDHSVIALAFAHALKQLCQLRIYGICIQPLSEMLHVLFCLLCGLVSWKRACGWSRKCP